MDPIRGPGYHVGVGDPEARMPGRLRTCAGIGIEWGR